MSRMSVWEEIDELNRRMYYREGRYLRLTEKTALMFILMEERIFGDEENE